MELTIDIPNIVKADCERRADVIEHKSNWSSTLADPCLRRLVYYRTQWDKAVPPSGWLQGRFDTGNVIEDLTVNYLNSLGMVNKPKFRLVEKGFHLNDVILDSHQIGGRPDTALQIDGQILGPVEIKSVHPNIFASLKTIDSMQKFRWMRGYITQLQLYTFGMNCETGFFLLVNTNNHKDIKFWPLPLDFELVESLLKKADDVNLYVTAGELPAKINEYEECSDCPFASICCPDFATKGTLAMVDDPDLASALDRLDELKSAIEEIGELENVLKAHLNKGQDVIVGGWMIMWHKTVAHLTARVAREEERWNKKIIRMK